jgi:hypothetical protein
MATQPFLPDTAGSSGNDLSKNLAVLHEGAGSASPSGFTVDSLPREIRVPFRGIDRHGCQYPLVFG